jgi:hypothetical protein
MPQELLQAVIDLRKFNIRTPRADAARRTASGGYADADVMRGLRPAEPCFDGRTASQPDVHLDDLRVKFRPL